MKLKDLKLNKKSAIKEDCSCKDATYEDALEQNKAHDDALKEVIKETTPEKVEKTSDIDKALEDSNVKAPENNMQPVVENCKDRAEVRECLMRLKEKNIKASIRKSVKEGYRYDVTYQVPVTLSESVEEGPMEAPVEKDASLEDTVKLVKDYSELRTLLQKLQGSINEFIAKSEFSDEEVKNTVASINDTVSAIDNSIETTPEISAEPIAEPVEEPVESALPDDIKKIDIDDVPEDGDLGLLSGSKNNAEEVKPVDAVDFNFDDEEIENENKSEKKKEETKESCKSTKKIEEDYGWEIKFGKEWDAYEDMLDVFGAESLCDFLAEAMGTENLGKYLAYICRMHDYNCPYLEGEEEINEDVNTASKKTLNEGASNFDTNDIIELCSPYLNPADYEKDKDDLSGIYSGMTEEEIHEKILDYIADEYQGMYDQVEDLLKDCEHVSVKEGYYEGYYIDFDFKNGEDLAYDVTGGFSYSKDDCIQCVENEIYNMQDALHECIDEGFLVSYTTSYRASNGETGYRLSGREKTLEELDSVMSALLEDALNAVEESFSKDKDADINESLKEDKENNPFKVYLEEAGVEPIFTFPNGDYLYVEYENGKLYAGSAANAGIMHEYEIEYDNEVPVETNINNLYEKIIEDKPELLDESHKVEKSQDGAEGLNESVKILSDLSDYKAWGGAVNFWNEIKDAHKEEELDFLLEELYPDGLTMTELNDLLWFEEDFVREQLGLKEEENFDEEDD